MARAAKPARSVRKRLTLVAGVLSVLVLGGCAARFTRLVESTVLFIPSRATFTTPAGIADVSIPGPKGTQLHGWWMPASTEAEPLGTVLFCHGNSGRLPDHLPFVERLPEFGYNVLMFDYRGYGRSGRAGLITRNTLIADSAAALKYVLDREDVDPDRLYLLGHSMGGVMAINTAANNPDTFVAVAAVSPFSAFQRVAADFSGPIGWALIQSGMDAEDSVQRFGRTPLLLVHGTRDGVVRRYHSDRIQEAAVEAGIESRVVSVDGAGHNNVFDPDKPTIPVIVEFFATHAPR